MSAFDHDPGSTRSDTGGEERLQHLTTTQPHVVTICTERHQTTCFADKTDELCVPQASRVYTTVVNAAHSYGRTVKQIFEYTDHCGASVT